MAAHDGAVANRGPDGSLFDGALNYTRLIFVLTVREIRQQTGTAALGFLMMVVQAAAMCLAFYFVITYFRMGAIAVRGDVMLFVLIGVGFFFTAQRAMMGSMKAMSTGWKMAAHPHINPLIMVYVNALAVLYSQTLAILIIYLVNGLFIESLIIPDPMMFFPTFLLTWVFGVGIGMVFGFLGYYFSWFSAIQMVFKKMLFITSGKFVNANLVPHDMLVIFQWNPLFHTIDQMRGAAFVNYVPQNTNMGYPLIAAFVPLVLGHLLYVKMKQRRNG